MWNGLKLSTAVAVGILIGLVVKDIDAGAQPSPPLGITVRDWCAGQALAGMMAQTGFLLQPPELAKAAFLQADAMMAKR